MAEGSKVRLVRCPNCDNLLPELPEYSVYQCGGCGTILRAKTKDIRSDIVSEKSDEEKGFLGSEKSESSIEKSRDIINSFTSEPETEANSGTKSNWRRKERVFTDKNADLVNTRFRRPDKREEDLGTFSDEFKGLRLDRSVEERYNNHYVTMSKSNQTNKFSGSLRTRPRMDFSGAETSRLEGIAGPSNYDPYPYPIEVEKLEQERAELIRKLDELKDQLTRPYQEREPFSDRNLSSPYPNPRPPQYFDQAPNFYSPRTHIPRPPPPPHQHHPHFSPREYYPDPLEYYHAPPRVPQRVPQLYSNSGGPANHISNFYRHDEPVVTVGLPPRGGYYHDRPRRTVRSRRRGVHPIAGGAPFVACQKCFEVLKLPRKKIIRSYNNNNNNYNQKLRCGGCSAVISLKVESSKKIVTEVVNSVESAEDYNQPSFNFCPAVTENGSLDETLSLEGSEKRKVYSSSPSVSSREEDSLPSAVSREDNVSEPVEDFPLKKPAPSPVRPLPPRSPTWHEPVIGNTSKGTVENEDGGNNDDDVAGSSAGPTEMDVPFEEYQHNNMSVDFGELSREDYEMRLSSSKENSDSFLVGFIKKGFRDISRSSHSVQTERPKVYINGHPLSDRVVKRAEKYAGTIRPGDYWYDYKGGFWGVMGQPCLGIIPSYIEEFNYPMPTNCGAGNTCVYVNGRELHQRDLDLLASRGLPTARNKFYIVEINGRVVDEDTGKELDNLGKLAPTVEKVKHGFGMKVPRVVTS